MARMIGYARVSRTEQDLSLQIDALESAGCAKEFIFTDKVSGSKEKRPGLDLCLKTLQSGDTLVVWRLDRLGRSISHLIDLVQYLFSKKIAFKSLCDGIIDTTTASGELIFMVFSIMAQFEKRLIQERTYAGLKAARSRGRVGGRPPLNPKDPRVIAAKKIHNDKTLTIKEICHLLKVSRATFYRFLRCTDTSSK